MKGMERYPCRAKYQTRKPFWDDQIGIMGSSSVERHSSYTVACDYWQWTGAMRDALIREETNVETLRREP
jgi:hypothetical protein